MTNKQKIIYQYIIPSLLASIFGILSVTLSTIYSFQLSETSWLRNIKYTQKEKVLNLRLDLIDELSRFIGNRNGMKDAWLNYQNSIKVVNNQLIVNDKYSEKISKLSSDHYSLMIRIGIWFGPLSKEAIRKIDSQNEKWWERNIELYLELLKSMLLKLNSGLDF